MEVDSKMRCSKKVLRNDVLHDPCKKLDLKSNQQVLSSSSSSSSSSSENQKQQKEMMIPLLTKGELIETSSYSSSSDNEQKQEQDNSMSIKKKDPEEEDSLLHQRNSRSISRLSRIRCRLLTMITTSFSSFTTTTNKSNGSNSNNNNSRHMTAILIIVLGIVASGTFLSIGISSAIEQEEKNFCRTSNDLVKKIHHVMKDYVNAASIIHNTCRNRDFTRHDFRQLYEYLNATGLDFQACQFYPNISSQTERIAAEMEAKTFYTLHYPHVDYHGFRGLLHENSTSVESMPQRDYYFPVHYSEPVIGNEAAIDLDMAASGSRQRTILTIMETGLPALSDRIRLVQETTPISAGHAYGMVLMHPGIRLSSSASAAGAGADDDDRPPWPRDLASIVIRIPDLLQRSTENHSEISAVYLYDQSDSSGKPVFLGAARITPKSDSCKDNVNVVSIEKVELDALQAGRKIHRQDILAPNKVLTAVTVSEDDTFEPNLIFVILGGFLILAVSVVNAIWVDSNMRRIDKYNALKAQADAEKTRLVLETSEQAAKAERELNDFIAHEVRNPVSAAMAACSFVKSSIHKEYPLQTEEEIQSTKEDLDVVENALNFVSDLLRNMLDMHRATQKKLKVDLAPTDILHDVLEPVAAMLHQRGGKILVEVDCPENLVVDSDRLRLKQTILNLGRNSAKFVDEGFIRLRALVVNDHVQLFVEDSGCGIPKEKHGRLFQKYQESLDLLSQGTGLGLFLCKNLIDLMDGEIYLDETYDSGIAGYPGARFVIDLKRPVLVNFSSNTQLGAVKKPKISHSINCDTTKSAAAAASASAPTARALPDSLSVLFVDDDPILRKMFKRMILNVAAPNWTIREASSGEAALQLCGAMHFDLIFVDQYMASTEKQLLGTETVELMRARGINCIICGLSANEKESEFLQAGANAFSSKPFPIERVSMTKELCRILLTDETGTNNAIGELRIRG